MTTSVLTVTYGAKTAMDCAVEGLATSTTLVAGWESDEVDNTATMFVDTLFEGFVTTGTTPTVNTIICVFVWGSEVSLATVAKDTLDGTASAETLTNVNAPFLKLAASMVVSASSNIRYDFGPISVASLFGGVMPQFWGCFVTHNTAANLNSTAANQAFSYSGVQYTWTT